MTFSPYNLRDSPTAAVLNPPAIAFFLNFLNMCRSAHYSTESPEARSKKIFNQKILRAHLKNYG
jgi:hypothetical protein